MNREVAKTAAIQADVGDYLKLTACTAVMLQPILALALTLNPSYAAQVGIGFAYNLVKFTAPAFIFGILYTTMRQTLWPVRPYNDYLRKQWHGLFVPTIWWTSLYLLVMPWVQQGTRYHSLGGFVWRFVNGNAAPHLWYNTMMLQFIVLMPLFWKLARWCGVSAKRAWRIVGGTVLFTLGWLLIYDTQVFHGPHMHSWYLLDRVFLSFLIYGIFGTLTWSFRNWIMPWLQRWWLGLAALALAAYYWVNRDLFAFDFPVKLTNAPYYRPVMVLYDLLVIGLVAALGSYQIRWQRPVTIWIHRFANFAYKAFLSNVFWEQLVWLMVGKTVMQAHLFWGILLTYAATWLLSFSSAFGLHALWRPLKATLKNRFGQS